MITRGEALRRFMAQTGMTYERVNRAGITMERCKCGMDCCSGWLAVNAPLSSDGRPRKCLR